MSEKVGVTIGTRVYVTGQECIGCMPQVKSASHAYRRLDSKRAPKREEIMKFPWSLLL